MYTHVPSELRLDFHTHTTASDGKLTPTELVLRAANCQIDVLAITDHDTMAGLAEARQAIAEHGLALTLVDGVELSVGWHGFEIHVVGLGVATDSAALQRFLHAQQQRRERRAERISQKLAGAGLAQIGPRAWEIAGNTAITRTHFAQALVDSGRATSLQAAFKAYLAKGKRAWVAVDWPELSQAVSVIHQAGGIAVLAHPGRYKMTNKWLRRLVTAFAQANGDAMEVALPQQRPDERRHLITLCEAFDLHASVGSDFHQPTRWLELGRNLQLPVACPTVLELLAGTTGTMAEPLSRTP